MRHFSRLGTGLLFNTELTPLPLFSAKILKVNALFCHYVLDL